MSRQVTVDFEGVSIKIQIQCESAAHSLCKIDKTINLIRNTASKIENSKIKEYEQYLLATKETIQKQINLFISKLEEYKSLKVKTINNHDINLIQKWKELNSTIVNEGKKLEEMVADLTGAKLAVIDQMVKEGLMLKINNIHQKTLDEINGIKHFDNDLLSKINSINDISLRELAYKDFINGNTNFDTILKNAQTEYDKILSRTSFIEDIKEELKNSGISQEKIENITSKTVTAKMATQISQEANAAIVDEKIRKETLKVIIKSIRDRGFIVDTKNNLKIDKEKKIVKLVAKKTDGKTAEFEISLNGKFMYHFDGYEGQACQKDITPFIEDLKNIYDINILHEEIIWSNPDKIQTLKYQHMNSNKGKN